MSTVSRPAVSPGFSELVEEGSDVTGTCVKQTTVSGETYLLNVATGEKVIPGSQRPDGTMRKPIKVRAGYTPAEERKAFRTRQQLSREQHEASAGSGIPGLTAVDDSRENSSTSTSNNTSSSKPRKKKQEHKPSVADKRAEDKLCKQMEGLEVREHTDQQKATDPTKRLRNVRKKINEIIELEKRVAAGEKLTPEQKDKMKRKPALLDEASELEKTLGRAE